MSGHWARGYLGLAGADQNGGGGGGGGAMLLTVTKTTVGATSTYTLNKTWKEIKDALAEGTRVVLYGEGTGELAGKCCQFACDAASVYDGSYVVFNYSEGAGGNYEWFVLGTETSEFSTDSEDGYPAVVIADK